MCVHTKHIQHTHERTNAVRILYFKKICCEYFPRKYRDLFTTPQLFVFNSTETPQFFTFFVFSEINLRVFLQQMTILLRQNVHTSSMASKIGKVSSKQTDPGAHKKEAVSKSVLPSAQTAY